MISISPLTKFFWIAGSVTLVTAALGFVVFVFLYGKLADWRATPMGRHVMAFMAVLAVILVYVLIVNFIPQFLGNWAIARFVIYTSVSVVVWWRVGILLRAQGIIKRKRRDKDADLRP